MITYSHNIYTTNNTQFFLFFFALNVFFIRHLGLVSDKGLYLRTSFYIHAFDWNLAFNLQDNDKLYVSTQLCFFDACNLVLGIRLEWFFRSQEP